MSYRGVAIGMLTTPIYGPPCYRLHGPISADFYLCMAAVGEKEQDITSPGVAIVTTDGRLMGRCHTGAGDAT